MEVAQSLATALFSANSIWSVVARATLWFVIAGVIIVSTDSPRPEDNSKKLRTNLGFILLFIVLSGGLMYLLFSYAPTAAAAG